MRAASYTVVCTNVADWLLISHPAPLRLLPCAGWDVGIASMQKGEKAIFTIAPQYAYGADGVGDGLIPGNSTLAFDVELIDFK